MFASPSSAQTGFLEEDEKAAIRDQLEKMLADPHFSHSRRFPSFLRFIVAQTLSGHADSLKERTLGIAIFGKNGDYDTVSDPIVRVTAAEIRKRIAQYYQESGHDEELRISLPLGSYIPHFDWPPQRSQAEAASSSERFQRGSHWRRFQTSARVQEEVEPLPIELPAVSTLAPRRWPTSKRKLGILAAMAAGVLLIACGFGFLAWKAASQSPVKTFWAPVLASSDPVLLCLADQTKYTAITLRDAGDPSIEHTLQDNLTAVLIDDLRPLARFAGILQSDGKKYWVLGEGSTTLEDLRNGPDVLIGAFDNQWTLRLTRPLRFHFANSPDMMRFSIVDSGVDSGSYPAREWSVNRAQQLATNIYRDYALVARFTDNTTGRVTIVGAGIARGGTIAAGEFLTNPGLLRQIEQLPGYTGRKNIELVLSTQIIGGEPGTPHIEASYIW